MQFKRINREFSTILQAVHAVSPKLGLKDLRHGQLPVTFFSVSPQVLEQHTRPFLHLETLHLTLDATKVPPKTFWERLGTTLQSATKLKNLRFGFDHFYFERSVRGLWSEVDNSGEFYIPLWKLLGSHVWSDLQSLRLDSLLICEIGLTGLLKRHSSSLCELQLYNICLEHGSFQSVLSQIRSNFSLKEFRIWGHLFSRHTPDEDWSLPPLRRPATINCPGMEYYLRREYEQYNEDQKIVPRRQAALALRKFVLQGGEWPMKASDTALGHWDFSDLICDGKDCWDVDSINRMWDNRAEPDDLAGWERSVYDYDTAFGVEDVEDVMQIFDDDDGLDTNGFDRLGLDDEGVHYSRLGQIFKLSNLGHRNVTGRTMVEQIKKAMNDYFREEELSGVPPEFKVEAPGWHKKVDLESADICESSKPSLLKWNRGFSKCS